MSDDKPRVRTNADGSYRIDAWQNAVSGMGVAGIDKSIYTKFGIGGNHIDWRTLSLMYRYDWLARKVCDRPAQDAVRRWINLDDDKLSAELERLWLKKKARKCISWARLYGGAALLLVVDDGQTAADPLRPERVKNVIDIIPIDRHHLQQTGQVLDPYAVRFGEPEFYTTNNGTVFHHSRVLKFTGTDLTMDEAENEEYWGGSYIELYHDAIKQFQGSMADVRHIMTESSIGELKIPGLTNSVAMGGKIFDVIQSRLDQFNLSKSVYRTAAMDKEEEFDFKQRQLTGLSDLMDRFMTQVSGATDMTELVLFGTTPGGLNASQREQLSIYYDNVRSIQEDDLTYALNTVLSCLARNKVPEWEFVPLQEPSDQEKADIRLKEAQAVQAIGDVAMLSPETVVEHLNGTGHFDLEASGGLPAPPDPEDML